MDILNSYDKDWISILASDTSYSNEETDWSPVYRWIIDRLEQGLTLDVGCGLGHFVSMIESIYPHSTIGLDTSSVAILVAKKRSPNTEFFIGEAETHPIIDSEYSYQNICFNFVLEHLSNDLDVLQRVPSGKNVFISVPFEESITEGHDHKRIYNGLSGLCGRYGGLIKPIKTDIVSSFNFLCLYGKRI